MRGHPGRGELALYPRRDLAWRRRFALWRHLRGCATCRAETAGFERSARETKDLAGKASLPFSEADWQHLEREMLGNIKVGVAAARCIENVGRGRFAFRTGYLLAALAVLFVLGWMTHIPLATDQRIVGAIRTAFAKRSGPPGPELAATGDSIGVESQGTALRLMHPRAAAVSLAGSSSLAARYVDEDSGQVTITKVYAQ